MDRLQAMRVFSKVATLGGFAAAARALHLSPAVVTRQVAELESDLGVRLLNRTTRRVALTAAGAEYLPRVQDVMERLDEADSIVREQTAGIKGQLTVMSAPSFATHQLVRQVVLFRRKYPEVQVLMSGTSFLESPDDEHDVSILLTRRGQLSGEFHARRLARCDVVICASPSYLAHAPAGRPALPADLEAHDCLTLATPGATRDWTFERAGEETTSLRPRRAIGLSNVDAMRSAVLADGGIAAVPSFVVADALTDGRVVRLLADWSLISFDIVAAYPTRHHLPSRTRAFVDFLVQAFGGADVDPWLDRGEARPPPASRA